MWKNYEVKIKQGRRRQAWVRVQGGEWMAHPVSSAIAMTRDGARLVN